MLCKKIKSILYKIEQKYSKKSFNRRYGDGIDVMDKNWDNMVILDACRLDAFSKYNNIDGELKKVVSRGNHSKSFIDENFAGRNLHDTIYITANPFVERISDNVFFRVYYSELFDEWDDSMNTIPPEAVVEAAIDMNRQYPNKRIIAHMMQPHAPYIGPTGKDLYNRYIFGLFNHSVKNNGDFDIPNVSIPQAMHNGPIEQHELKQAYEENVQIALRHAEYLTEELGGKSVITADHGEMLGERVLFKKRYSHGRFHTPELRVVPWLIVDADERRNITSGSPKSFKNLEERETHLEALGYK